MLNQPKAHICTLALLGSCLSANADTYKLDFRAEGLKYVTYSGVIKEPFVQTGSFIVNADPDLQAINAILSVDLVIDGHAYTTSEIGLLAMGTSKFMFGGTLTGLTTIATRTNDFFLEYTWGLPQSGYLVYASETSPGTASAFDVSYQLRPVPEPSAVVMAIAGLGVAATTARRTMARGHQLSPQG